MQYKFFVIPALGGDSGAGEAELNAFLRGHRVLKVHHELKDDGQVGVFWCFCVEYLQNSSVLGEAGRFEKRERIDYREALGSDEAFARFQAMRAVRRKLAEEDAVPPYAIMLDEQLAELAKKPLVDESALKSLKGFGEKKFAKYGPRFLKALGEAPDETGGESV